MKYLKPLGKKQNTFRPFLSFFYDAKKKDKLVVSPRQQTIKKANLFYLNKKHSSFFYSFFLKVIKISKINKIYLKSA